jgi:hypothetical protein
MSPEIMAYPEDHGDFILDTDACDSSIGAVLSQIQDGRLRVIAYGSRTLNKAEKNYHQGKVFYESTVVTSHS